MRLQVSAFSDELYTFPAFASRGLHPTVAKARAPFTPHELLERSLRVVLARNLVEDCSATTGSIPLE
jgi:hypothetical protein